MNYSKINSNKLVNNAEERPFKKLCFVTTIKSGPGLITANK